MSVTMAGQASAIGSYFGKVLKLSGMLQAAPHKGYGHFSSLDSIPIDPQVDNVRDILLSAGWTFELPVTATATLSAPFGWGYTGFQSHVCSLIGPGVGIAFVYYDPTSGPPTGKINGLPIWAVPIGGTNAASQINLVAALNATLAVTAIVSSITVITIFAIAPGTLGDGIRLTGQGSISIGSVTTGGGWVLQSQSPINRITGVGNQLSIRLTVQSSFGGIAAPMILTIEVAGTSIQMPMQKSAFWHLIADDYQCCFISTAGFHAGDVFVFNNYLWACLPYIAENVPSVIAAAFVMQPSNAGFVGPTIGASGGMTIDTWVNGTHLQTGPGQDGFSLVCLHSEDGEILDRSNQPVIQPAYLMLPADYIGEGRIIGYIPDAFVSSTPLPVATQQAFGGDMYRVVATQDLAPGCCFLMTAEKDNVQTPSGGTTLPPGKLPKYSAGVATLQGVTFDEGSLIQPPVLEDAGADLPFDASWVGKTIIISGEQYTVVNVTMFSPLPPGVVALSGTGTELTFSPSPVLPGTTVLSVTWSLQTA